ncbi:hypothetical protein JXO52_00845 [bacterium]|nr:hypothetical protein [bacterium]
MTFSKQTAVFAVITALALLVFSGCAKDGGDSSTGPDVTTGNFLWVHLDGDSVKVDYDDLPVFDINTLAKPLYEETDAIWLTAFIDTNLIPNYVDDGDVYDPRELYAYRFEGDDGFSASTKGYADNTWEQLGLGYILCAIRRVIFPDELIDLPGAYNVSDVARVLVSRKIDVTSPDSSGFVRLADLSTVQVQNWDGITEDAVSLADIATRFVNAPAGHEYNLAAIDGYSFKTALTWEQFQTGYWLLDSRRTIFTHADLGSSKYKMSYLQTIVVAN